MPAQPDGPTALVIPVREAEPVVGRWRERHDASAAQGMPAHVTVLYPFLTQAQITTQVTGQLTELFAQRAGFTLTFQDCARFPAGVLHLAPHPAGPLRALTEAVAAAWPQTPPYGGQFEEIIPHLTVAADTDTEVLGRIEEQIAAMLPITATVTQAWLYAPAGSRWAPHLRLPLGTSSVS